MEEEKTQKEDTSPYLVPGAIILAGVLVAGAVIYTSSPRAVSTRGTAAVSESAGTVVTENLADDDPVLGNPEAPVTVVEFSDFQCPFCRRFYATTLPAIKEQYVKSGKVKFVYRDFPLTSIHDMAQKYAESAECADEQGKFWVMHDKIFDEQEKKGAGTVFDYTTADVKRWAREADLNVTQFDECLDSGKYAAEVEKDFADGQKGGVTGTPGTFVNGRLIQGAVPFAQFQAVIEEELRRVGQ